MYCTRERDVKQTMHSDWFVLFWEQIVILSRKDNNRKVMIIFVEQKISYFIAYLEIAILEEESKWMLKQCMK